MAKRMQNDPAAASGDGTVDMTPMIDVTFQLIIFFMCVTDMADNSRERLMLPEARKAEIDVVEPGRLVVNVNKEGHVVIAGRARSDAELRRIFELEAHMSPKGSDNLPSKAIYVRADRYTDYRFVERVMALAQEHRLWRLMFNTANPEFAAAARGAAG